MWPHETFDKREVQGNFFGSDLTSKKGDQNRIEEETEVACYHNEVKIKINFPINPSILCNFSYFNAIKDEQDPEQSIQDTDIAAYLSQLLKTTGNYHKSFLNKTTTSLHQEWQRNFDGNYSTQMTQA